MYEPTRFGEFLLLKKLGDGPLGETYRAGRIQGASIGEMVLLRTFSIPGADAVGLEKTLQDFASSRHRIEGPGLTYAVESGQVGGVAFVAYRYATGWDLSRLIETANTGFSELERDYGLLIAERLAKGLTVVHQTDPSLGRPFHGFLVPQNVLLTSDGDIDLVGFEAGPLWTRAAAGGALSELHPYLSPEVRAGQAPGPRDDVYSLGALLWHLLIGEPPPSDVASGLATHLASAKLINGEILPTELAELLQSSLAAARARTPDSAQWHRQLTEWLGRNQVTTTHFDLAFFIHELFRMQIQEEEAEIEKEKKLDLSPTPATVSSEPEISGAILRPDLSGTEHPPLTAQKPADEASGTGVRVPPAKRSKAPLVLGLMALLLAASVGAWFALRGSTAEPPPPPPVQAAPAPPPPAVPSADLQMAELELERLVQEQAKTVGDQLAEEYAEQIASLREQLDAAQKAEAEAMRAVMRPSSPPPAPPPPAPPPPAPPPPDPAPQAPPSTPEPATAATTVPEITPPEVDTTNPPAEESDNVLAQAGAATDAPPGPASSPTEDIPAPATTSTSEPPPAVEDPPASAEPAEIAPPAPDTPIVLPPKRLRMKEPSFPNRARQYRKEATVLVKVLVNTRGRVLDAQLVVEKNDPYGFHQEALRAARTAVFEPARSDGVPTEMWTTVVISFKMK